ncbi:MAG: sulfite exporter TauE/SafE family protein [Idiomarina sp.]|nr:sulfite exporter TauE/SafE family protein [Idiomarina sp.]
MSIEWVLLGIFIWIAFTSEAITGFGSIVIAIALGSLLYPIPELIPILVPLSLFMTSAMIWRFWHDIDRQLMMKSILPFMGAGLILGILLVGWLSSDTLKRLFAVLLIWFAGRELYKRFRGLPLSVKPRWWQPFWTFLAGITHGLFASGGPLLVYSLNSRAIPKAQFRATLVSVWFVLNAFYTTVLLLQERVQPVFFQTLSYLPVLLLSFWMGHALHKRVSETNFRTLVYVLLLIAALAMLR